MNAPYVKTLYLYGMSPNAQITIIDAQTGSILDLGVANRTGKYQTDYWDLGRPREITVKISHPGYLYLTVNVVVPAQSDVPLRIEQIEDALYVN